jgi:hypothetical protein
MVRTPAIDVSMVGLLVVGTSPGARNSRVGDGVLDGVNVIVGVDVIDGVKVGVGVLVGVAVGSTFVIV